MSAGKVPRHLASIQRAGPANVTPETIAMNENSFLRLRLQPIRFAFAVAFSLMPIGIAHAAEPGSSKEGQNPADHLPPHIRRVTWFGERADWSHDSKRILFVEKTFGDVYEVELASEIIRAMTHHYPHYGYTRALYLANGDILLSGPDHFDPKKPGDARTQCWLFLLDKSLTRPALALGSKCSEGPAASRKRMHIA